MRNHIEAVQDISKGKAVSADFTLLVVTNFRERYRKYLINISHILTLGSIKHAQVKSQIYNSLLEGQQGCQHLNLVCVCEGRGEYSIRQVSQHESHTFQVPLGGMLHQGDLSMLSLLDLVRWAETISDRCSHI